MYFGKFAGRLQEQAHHLRGQAIDGKQVRGAGAHGRKIHLVSRVWHEGGIVLAQVEQAEKTNEIKAVPILPRGRNLKGIVITIVITTDALLAQRSLAQQILDQGGDYLMIIRGQPARNPRGNS